MTGKAGAATTARALNPMPSPCVYPKEPWSTGKIVDVMVRRLGFPKASSTPGKVRLIRAGLVIGCPGWGALAVLMVGQHASAASDVAATTLNVGLLPASRRLAEYR